MIELSKYELDGICLDAVEYEPTTDSGYNPAITREFRMAKEADPAGLTIDLDEDSTWMKWVAFREDQLTSLVQLMSETARETAKLTSRTILVSATVQPDYEESRGRNRHYQHWAQWLREGLIDVSIPQCFSNELPGLEQQLWQVRSVHMGSGIACIPGLALDDKKPQNRPSLKDQKQLLSNAGFQHCTILDYEALKAEMERPAKAHDHKKRRFWDLFKRENEEPN